MSSALAGAGRKEPELWLVDLAAAAPALETVESATPRLSRADLDKIAAMADPSVGNERRSTYIALRILIERTFGKAWRTLPYDMTPTGKPTLHGASGQFSLSHVSGLALIGIAPEGSIGVDIERTRTVRMSEDRRLGVERAGVEVASDTAPLSGTADERLLRAWVRLEAVAKADGIGIGRMLALFGVSRGAAARDSALPLAHLAHDIPLGDGLYAAVALPKGQATPVVATFPVNVTGLERLALIGDGGTSR